MFKRNFLCSLKKGKSFYEFRKPWYVLFYENVPAILLYVYCVLTNL